MRLELNDQGVRFDDMETMIRLKACEARLKRYLEVNGQIIEIELLRDWFLLEFVFFLIDLLQES